MKAEITCPTKQGIQSPEHILPMNSLVLEKHKFEEQQHGCCAFGFLTQSWYFDMLLKFLP